MRPAGTELRTGLFFEPLGRPGPRLVGVSDEILVVQAVDFGSVVVRVDVGMLVYGPGKLLDDGYGWVDNSRLMECSVVVICWMSIRCYSPREVTCPRGLLRRAAV